MLDQNKHRRYMYDILIDISNSPLKNYITFKFFSYYNHILQWKGSRYAKQFEI